MRPLKTSESVAREIVRHIVTEGLATGDGLPHESAMLEMYGVSRESLREALRLLETQGLISIRRGPGGGPVVGTVDPAHLGRMSTLYYHLAGATYAELFEAWVAAEAYIAGLAARNPDRETVRSVMAPFRQLHDDVADEPLEQFVEDHTAFHEALGTLAGNKVMQLSLMAIGQIVTHHILNHVDPRLAGDMVEQDHAAIATAVASGHSSKARSLMEAHIRALVGVYEKSLAASDDYIEWR